MRPHLLSDVRKSFIHVNFQLCWITTIDRLSEIFSILSQFQNDLLLNLFQPTFPFDDRNWIELLEIIDGN